MLVEALMTVPLPAAADLRQEADRTIAAAREAAQQNRNAEAAVLFEWAISQDPSRRMEWLRELADQMTYSGRAKEAVPLFGDLLASGKLSAQETRWARLGLGLALRWSHQYEVALQEYGGLIAQDPKDTGARLGRAQGLAEMGRYGLAKTEYETVLGQDPGNKDAWSGLRDLASRMSNSGQAKEAVPIYHEMLAAGKLSAEETRRARLDLAQALSWSDQLAESLREYEALLALDPKDTETQREHARVLHWMGRHQEALREYEALILQDPKDTWSRIGRAEVFSSMGRNELARQEYEAVLGQEPGQIQARLRRAEILMGTDKDAAKREYEAVLRFEPENLKALGKLGQVQEWRGKHQDAERRLTAILKKYPDDGEAALYLAQSQYWNGRPDRAKQTLHDLLAHRPADLLPQWLRDEFQHLRDNMERGERPATGFDYQNSHQSDRLVISVQSYEQNFQLHDGRTTLGPRYQSYDYDPRRGQPSISVHRPGLFGRHRLGDRTEVTGSLYLDQIDPGGRRKSHTLVTYNTYLTLWPNDLLRFYVGSSRATFDNVKSLTQGITATYANFSMDVVPEERTRLTTRFNWGDYTDGNRQLWGQLELERRLRTDPDLLIGVRYTRFGFSKRLDNGYFNPDSYQSGVFTLRFYGHTGGRFYYDLDGAYGREHANPGGGKPFSSWGVRLTYRITDRVEIQARDQFFSSREASSGGFSRRTKGIFLRVAM